MKRTTMLALAVALLSPVACKKRDAAAPAAPSATTNSPAPASIPTASVSASSVPAALAKLTPNELKWGISPTRNDKVTYQDDVIIMEHGSDAVRAMASNGLTWTIDANAPHADEIKPDKILFATGRVMGRVLAVERKGDGLAVTLGPVAITDVIKEANLSADQPLDLSSMIVYTAPDYPGATTHDKPDSSTSFGLPQVPVFFASYAPPAQGAGLPEFGAPKEILIDKFRVIPVCCGGLGITLVHDGEGVKMMATAVIQLKNPSVHFDLYIHNGAIVTALVELHGAAGFRVHFNAGTDVGISGNIHQNFFVPVDATFPIGGIAVPLSVVIRQTLTVTSIFTAQNATIDADGEYEFGGTFEAGKRNGGEWGAQGPSSLTVKKSLANSIGGASLGVNGLVFGYGAKIIVGIGAFGFVTGPYLGYNTIVGVSRGSDMTMAGLPPCHAAQLKTSLRYGVGYQMPQLVTDAINLFLRALNVKPIMSEGGIEKNDALIDKYEVYPPNCGTKPKE